jgi:hypothetical protein
MTQAELLELMRKRVATRKNQRRSEVMLRAPNPAFNTDARVRGWAPQRAPVN